MNGSGFIVVLALFLAYIDMALSFFIHKKSCFKSLVCRNAAFTSITDRVIEKDYWKKSIPYVIGCDESGRGCLAGPVVSAAVCSPFDSAIMHEVNDSKQVSAKTREKIFNLLQQDSSIIFSYSRAENTIVDEINILQATLLSMKNCISDTVDQIKLKTNCSDTDMYAIIDGNKCPNKLPIKSKPLVKGDTLCYPIALASIIAKVQRDKIMLEYDLLYPQYGFAKNKGYPSRQHMLAIHQYGPCPIHRMTFKPLKGRLPVLTSSSSSHFNDEDESSV